VPECPANAIYAQDDVPADQQKFIEINAELSAHWPTITRRKDALSDAEEWLGKPNKIVWLDRS